MIISWLRKNRTQIYWTFLSLLPLWMFNGVIRIPDSFFTSMITVNGFFLAFTILFLSLPWSLGFSRDKENFRFPIKILIARQLVKGPITPEKQAEALSKLNNEEGDRLVDEVLQGLSLYMDQILSGLLSGFAWVITMFPFLFSIILSLAGLLQESSSTWLAFFSTGSMLVGLVNASWRIIERKAGLDQVWHNKGPSEKARAEKT